MDRAPPPQGPPPSYAFVTKVYKRSLRPVIIAVTLLGGFWSLFSGIGFFRNVPFYSREGADTLKILAIVLGALYMVVTAIEAFGLFAGATQKLGPARIFAWLSVAVVIIIAAIGLARTVIHFTQKDVILNTCINAADGLQVVYTGFWGPITSDRLSRTDATFWCNRSWDRGSWSEIISFIATTLLAILFTSIAFGYYRQLLDPSGAHNVFRAPAAVIRTETYPSAYAPPYNPAAPTPYPTYGNYTPTHQPYSAYPAYAPPSGPPPQDGKPPGYSNEGGWKMPADKNPFDDAPPVGGSNPRP